MMRNSIGPGLSLGSSTTRTVLALLVVALFQTFGCKPAASVYRGNLCTITRPLALDGKDLHTGAPLDSLKTEELYVVFNTQTGNLDSLPVATYQNCINPRGAFIPSCANVQFALDSIGENTENLAAQQSWYSEMLYQAGRDSTDTQSITAPPDLAFFCSTTGLAPDDVEFRYTMGGRGAKGKPDTVRVAPISSMITPTSRDSTTSPLEFLQRFSLNPEVDLLFTSIPLQLEMFRISSGDYGLFEAAQNCQDTLHMGPFVISVDREEIAQYRSSKISTARADWQQALDAYQTNTGCDPQSSWVTSTTTLVTDIEGSFALADAMLMQLQSLPPCDAPSMATESTAVSPSYTPCTSTAGTTIMFGPECSGPCTISIVSSGGTVVYTQNFTTPPGSWDPRQYINLQGIYFVSIMFSDGQETHKIKF